ncbi:LUD domain-containing protein [Chitinophaga sp. Mgbs1]|uniref:LUD domain-containing protein n=1 Tax=Chitinophaga solisilvae TaxID=1233460 RepID=A0A433WF61_9BACT|nr:LUD domain-containing protein [Chitinophaga solisilvae]
MSSRDKILSAVKMNQPEQVALPSLDGLRGAMPATLDAYRKVLESLGGSLFEISDEKEIPALLAQHYPELKRVIAATSGERSWIHEDPHTLEDVDMAVIRGQWAVAENGAVWVTEEEAPVRVLPFICQHLAIVISRERILATMHDAYEKIGLPLTGFGVFIAGPSKTADIEQSLVLGAHGAKSLVVFAL